MSLDLTKLNNAVTALEAKLAAQKQQITDLTAQVAAHGDTSTADQAAVDAVADKISQDVA